MPAIAAADSNGPLRVLATTSIIGDVVGRVGGEAIDLTTLMQPGQDPHSFQPGAADLTAAADADLIFVNGWNLEEGLGDDLTTIGRGAALVPVSAGIEPLARGHAADPHVWQDVAHVIDWVENIRAALGAADPANAATYDANAAAYRAELEQLDADLRAALEAIPAGRRVLVTNHDNLGYFAAAYGFEVLGAVIPTASTLAEPTAGELAELARLMDAAGVCTLFIETTAGEELARTLTGELSGCDEVRVLALYADALGRPGSGADSYAGMMRTNAATLVEGLAE
jgi:ABC-type Zn uptake system ZnuABC Zn-binding protein ZnuA